MLICVFPSPSLGMHTLPWSQSSMMQLLEDRCLERRPLAPVLNHTAWDSSGAGVSPLLCTFTWIKCHSTGHQSPGVTWCSCSLLDKVHVGFSTHNPTQFWGSSPGLCTCEANTLLLSYSLSPHVGLLILSRLLKAESYVDKLQLLAKHVWSEFIQNPNKSNAPSGQTSCLFW